MKCEWCGEEFEATRPNRRFCCDACRVNARAREVECTCRECGKHFTTSKAEVRRGRGQFCEKKCAVVWGNKQRGYEPKSQAIAYAECAECGAVFVKRMGALFCGDECRRLMNNRRVRKHLQRKFGYAPASWQEPGTYVCERCGEQFIVSERRAHRRKYCSSRCADSAGFHRYRVTKRDAIGHHTGAEWRALLDKWGGRCAYCGCKLVTGPAHRNNPRLATRDHVVALANGGTDDISNIVPACLVCNGRKGSSDVAAHIVDHGGQLALAAVCVSSLSTMGVGGLYRGGDGACARGHEMSSRSRRLGGF